MKRGSDHPFASRPRSRRLLLTGYAALMVAAGACKPDGDPPLTAVTLPVPAAAVAAHIGAPEPSTPVAGADVSEAQPTLTIRNASVADDSVLTYSFQVSSDPDFTTLAVETTTGIQQGSSGQTSWTVATRLDERTYFWRARGVNRRGAAGPYSRISSFTIRDAGVLVFDPLTNGSSVGDPSGGKFLSHGWQVTNKTDFIRYTVPTVTSGFVEWENTGLRTTNPAPDNVMLLGMWDASPEAGPYRTNAFRVHIRKLDDAHEPPHLRLRWIANGEQHDAGANVQFWDPGRVYRWRIDWGPSGLGNTVQVFLDDVPILLQQYTRDYTPKRHWIELGVEERRESIVGVVYSNVRIGRR